MQKQIKNTLQGTNSIVIEAKKNTKHMSKLEDIMEITEAEQNKEEKRTASETSGTTLSAPTFES